VEHTLQYLASGDGSTPIKYQFRIPNKTICLFISEVLSKIDEELQPYIKVG
jgi:hypothetical protein